MVVCLSEIRFQEWLERELLRRGSTKAKLAAGIERKPQTVYAWFNEGRTPSPELCILIARLSSSPQPFARTRDARVALRLLNLRNLFERRGIPPLRNVARAQSSPTFVAFRG